MAELIPLRFGKYTLLDRIAIGGMAELYRALISGDQGFEKLVAVKRLLPYLADEENVVRAFVDEARLAALLHHRNIVHVYDFGNMEGAYFIAMEYLLGKDLNSVVKKTSETGRDLDLESALCIVSQICEGLDYAHRLKDLQGNPLRIIHRDLSPHNIFINYSGEVKIIDFGIAKAAGQSSKTQLGTIKGKAAYMSPEQARGEPIDHRSDIFSAGILLYELVTHTRMFSGDVMEILSQVREARIIPAEQTAPGKPPEIYTILHKALSVDPGERYQTSKEMLADLEDFIHRNGFRYSPHNVALFMSDLFENEIVTEELTIHEVTKIEARDQAEPNVPQNPNPEDTVILDPQKFLDHIPSWRPYAFFGVPILLVAAALLVSFYMSWSPVTSLKGPIAAPTPSGTQAGAPAMEVEAPPGLFHAGLAALEGGRYSEAADIFKELLETDPTVLDKISGPYDRALREIASGLENIDPEKAESLLMKAASVNPMGIQTRFRLGLLYVSQNQYTEAKEVFEEAARIDPLLADTYFNLGYIHAMTRDYDMAEKMYARVVDLAPAYLDEAYFNLATVQEKGGRIDESLVNLEHALAVNPENQPARDSLERLKRDSGKE